MKNCNNLWLCVLAVVLMGFAPARADEPLHVTLTSQKVIKSDDGTEALLSAEEAKPGNVLQYAAVYSNASDRALANLEATLPIPTGTEWQLNTAQPTPTAASVDGQQFAPFPLKRIVKQPDGTEREELVPAKEYRALRWSVPALKAGASLTVQARAQINPVNPTE